ncbi:MAG: replication protein RepA [Erythrobacter sp.]
MTHDSKAPIGHQYALAMLEGGEDTVRSLSSDAASQLTLDAFLRVQDEDPVPAFLHSALCAMSLPTKRPKDETAPIIREDGRYALAINPRPVLQEIDGEKVLQSLGVPFGSYPRVALIYILSQAVKQRSRDVFLGRNFTDWMRRLGYQTISYGPRGTANLMKQQVDRLLACEWQIRWDGGLADENAFAVRDVKLSSEYSGSLAKDGDFTREIRMSEVFYEHLIEHAVPLNENAIRELKGTPTALDLYTYLAYRLPRVTTERGQAISWSQLAKHLGNSTDNKRFRQTVRQTIQLVSSVYPNANVDVSGRTVVLYPSPAPLEKKLIGSHLRLVGVSPHKPKEETKGPARTGAATEQEPKIELIDFPSGTLRFGRNEEPFFKIGQSKGAPWDVDIIAGEFRRGCPDFKRQRTQKEWLRVWERFVVSFAERRKANS